MKKILLTCVALLAFGFGGAAQEVESRRPEAMLLDYDTSLTVKCPSGSISGYATSYYHIEPANDGMVRRWSSPDGRYRKHECSRDNAQAQRIYLARLEKLDSPDIYRHPLSHEAEKIVYNFELITGIRNSGDGDFIGWCYISHQTRNGWKVWFNKNKDKLRYCAEQRVLYVEELPTIKPDTNRIDPNRMLNLNDVCWPILSRLPGFYSITDDGRKLTPGGAYCVVSMEATAHVELVGNDSVRISGTVADSKTWELLPLVLVYAVDTNADKEYLINSTVTESDFDGNYSFTVERKDGQLFILHALGYKELLLQLRCCTGCAQEHLPSSFIKYP